MIKSVFFDLDGTLLPMDQNLFIKAYFGPLTKKVASVGIHAEALVQTIWKFMWEASKNDGSRSNELLFWQIMEARFGKELCQKAAPLFEEYYEKDFEQVRKVCGYNPKAKEVIQLLKAHGIRPILATNPIFPAVATHARVRWAGLDAQDFLHITVLENSFRAKPDPLYYQELLTLAQVKAEDCLMVGNDIEEDGAAAQLGMQVFFLTDCLINRKNEDFSSHLHGDFNALLEFLKKSFAETLHS